MWFKLSSIYHLTLLKIFSLCSNLAFLSFSFISFGNGSEIIVRSVKHLPKEYLQATFLYFRQDFEWVCSCYMSMQVWILYLIRDRRLDYSSNKTDIFLLIFFCYFWCTNHPHKKECICGLPRNWNSTLMA